MNKDKWQRKCVACGEIIFVLQEKNYNSMTQMDNKKYQYKTAKIYWKKIKDETNNQTQSCI